MPLDGQRVVQIIMEECAKLPEPYSGYRKDVRDVITDILALERQHGWQSIPIQKRIIDKFDAAGELLLRKQAAKDTRSENSR